MIHTCEFPRLSDDSLCGKPADDYLVQSRKRGSMFISLCPDHAKVTVQMGHALTAKDPK